VFAGWFPFIFCIISSFLPFLSSIHFSFSLLLFDLEKEKVNRKERKKWKKYRKDNFDKRSVCSHKGLNEVEHRAAYRKLSFLCLLIFILILPNHYKIA